jgi:hypothetical protein
MPLISLSAPLSRLGLNTSGAASIRTRGVRTLPAALNHKTAAFTRPARAGGQTGAMTLTGWGALLGLLVVAAVVVAAIVLIIRFVIRHRRGYD